MAAQGKKEKSDYIIRSRVEYKFLIFVHWFQPTSDILIASSQFKDS